jgi:beta-mannosidase
MYAKGQTGFLRQLYPKNKKEKYQKLIKDCKDANMNMIRVEAEFTKTMNSSKPVMKMEFWFGRILCLQEVLSFDEEFQKN